MANNILNNLHPNLGTRVVLPATISPGTCVKALQSLIQQEVYGEVSIDIVGRTEVGDDACWDSQTAQHCEDNSHQTAPNHIYIHICKRKACKKHIIICKQVTSMSALPVTSCEVFQGLTCAGDRSEHPALAIFDRSGPGLAPLFEDRHAASPSIRCNSVRVRLMPLTGQNTPVSIRVHLNRWRLHVEQSYLKLNDTFEMENISIYHVSCYVWICETVR